VNRTIQTTGKEHAENFFCIGYQTQPSSAAAPTTYHQYSQAPQPTSCTTGSQMTAKIAFQEGQFSMLDHMLYKQQCLLSSFTEERVVLLYKWKQNTDHKTNLCLERNYSPFRDYKLLFFQHCTQICTHLCRETQFSRCYKQSIKK